MGELSHMRQRTHWLILGRERELQVISECVAKAVGGLGGGVVVLEVRHTYNLHCYN
jgi:hypothetical protein